MHRKIQKLLAALMAAIFLLYPCGFLYAETAVEPEDLYALSAVLMDAESGRVLYEKEGNTPRANASTTKVLTCILAIENAPGDDYVQVSERAASQPEVKLGMQKGEQYYLEDLLYSLMLKSHNDTAVAIAEHIAGSVEAFADMLNEKAKKIGCKNTYFITPNGLDEEDEYGMHHTTAVDLARIMRYAIKNPVFLHITQTRDYSFSDIRRNRHFSIHNANALFDLTDGVISGKTGFTGEAGYCYVCACEKQGKTFIISLLGCGWPNNKTYKWKDTLRLLKYGENSYYYTKLYKDVKLPEIVVERGLPEEDQRGKLCYARLRLEISEEEKNRRILLKKDEKITAKINIPKQLCAPVKKNQVIGSVDYYVNGQKWKSMDILAAEEIRKISFVWCILQILDHYFY